MQYVIKWTVKSTGVTGYDTEGLTLEAAKQWVLKSNERFKDITYEVVPYTKKLKDKIQ